jgi:hypothetical protein
VNTKLVEDAIHKAIGNGAAQARPRPDSSDPETDLVYSQTDVEVEGPILDEFVADLKHDRQLARLDTAFAMTPGGGGRTSLRFMAKPLLAHAISSSDVSSTAKLFCSLVETNSTPAIAVMAVTGVKADVTIKLSENIQLMPMTAVPRSIPRAEALCLTDRRRIRWPAPTALVTNFEYQPVFYWPVDPDEDLHWPDKGFQSAWTAARQCVNGALDDLHEARMLLSLLELNPTYLMAWVQSKSLSISHSIMGLGLVHGGADIPSNQIPSYDFVIEENDVQQITDAFFGVSALNRRKILHVPLDRLDRSIHENDFTDRVIDLGIALEALLLHEQKGDRGELRFRLGLRGAWLLGRDAEERIEIQRALAKVYQLRSDAVHVGKVERNDANERLIEQGTVLCRRLIRKMIEAHGRIDWNTLVVGGAK